MIPFGDLSNEEEGNGQSSIAALLTMLLKSMGHGQQQQQAANNGLDLNGLVKSFAQARDPVGYADKMTSLPSYYPGSGSPFNTGWFRSNAERAGIEQDRLGQPGITGLGNVPNLQALLQTRAQMGALAPQVGRTVSPAVGNQIFGGFLPPANGAAIAAKYGEAEPDVYAQRGLTLTPMGKLLKKRY